MKKRNRVEMMLLALLLSLSLTAPAFAANNDTPEITITWLSAEGEPAYYNGELGWLTLYDQDAYRYSCIDLSTGAQVEYDALGIFSDGLAWVAKYDAGGNRKFGYIDRTGTLVVPLEYVYVCDFSDGLAQVIDYDVFKYGYIDKTGAMVIPPEYNSASDFSDGLACVMYDANGYWKYGYIDKTGAVVIPFRYDNARTFSDGLAAVAKYDADGLWKWGYINKTGAVVIPLEYDGAGNFSDGLAVVAKKDADGNWKCGYIDKTNAVVVPLEYDSAANSFSDGLALVMKYDVSGNERWGYINTTGAVVISLEYDNANDFSDGLAAVAKEDADGNERWGYIDKTGAVVVPLEYDITEDFSNGLARVAKEYADGNLKYGFVDEAGAMILPLEYDGAGAIYEYYSEGRLQFGRYCWVKKGLSYGIFENPNYQLLEVPSDPEPKDTNPVNSEESGEVSPAPNSSSPEDQGTQDFHVPDDTGGTIDNGDGFPVVPVVITIVTVVAAVVVVLVLKKKKTALVAPSVAPSSTQTSEIEPEQRPKLKFSPQRGPNYPRTDATKKNSLIKLVMFIFGVIISAIIIVVLVLAHFRQKNIELLNDIWNEYKAGNYSNAFSLAKAAPEPYDDYYSKFISYRIELDSWCGTEKELYEWLLTFMDEMDIESIPTNSYSTEERLFSMIDLGYCKERLMNEKSWIESEFKWYSEFYQIRMNYYQNYFTLLLESRELFNATPVAGVLTIPYSSVVRLDSQMDALLITSIQAIDELQKKYNIIEDENHNILTQEKQTMEEYKATYYEYVAVSSMYDLSELSDIHTDSEVVPIGKK